MERVWLTTDLVGRLGMSPPTATSVRALVDARQVGLYGRITVRLTAGPDPKETFTVSVALRQPSERSGRTTKELTVRYSARTVVHLAKAKAARRWPLPPTPNESWRALLTIRHFRSSRSRSLHCSRKTRTRLHAR